VTEAMAKKQLEYDLFGDGEPPLTEKQYRAVRTVLYDRDQFAAMIRMACDRLGGKVEGRPPGPHNFLQRIDQLVRADDDDPVSIEDIDAALKDADATVSASGGSLFVDVSVIVRTRGDLRRMVAACRI
jgi:hypothetical protein